MRNIITFLTVLLLAACSKPTPEPIIIDNDPEVSECYDNGLGELKIDNNTSSEYWLIRDIWNEDVLYLEGDTTSSLIIESTDTLLIRFSRWYITESDSLTLIGSYLFRMNLDTCEQIYIDSLIISSYEILPFEQQF